MQEPVCCHCSQWNNQQKVLLRLVGKATGWKLSRCRYVQISELGSIEEYNQVVMEFLTATDIGKIPPKLAENDGQ